MIRRSILLAAAMLLGGCAGQYHEPALPIDHPANPAAQAASERPRSETLSPAPADAAASPEEPDAAAHDDHAHGAHGHAAPGAADEQPPLYACPMHPEVTGRSSDERCPKCGMRLTDRVADGDEP